MVGGGGSGGEMGGGGRERGNQEGLRSLVVG